MNEILSRINWMEIVTTLWTAVLLPLLSYIGTQIYCFLKSKKLDKYGDALYSEIIKAVKSVYETTVKDIKGTSDWTEEKQEEIKDMAKNKALQALSHSAIQILKEEKNDFDSWLDSMIGTALYDIKHN